MNKRLLTVLVFALAVSGLATFLIYKVIQGKIVGSSHPPTTTLLVAAKDLGVGALIKDGDFKAADWSGPIPMQALNKPEEVNGRGVVAAIYAGEPIMETRLAPKGGGAGLAAMIPKGKRAVAVRVNEVVGVAGFVLPGMRVDILVSGNPPNAPQNLGTQTKTILQNIEVLSAGQSIQKDAENKPISVQVVNLLVTPEQAEALSLASNDARIQLVLRNPLDTDEARTPGTAMAALFGKTYFSATPEPAPTRPVRKKVTPPPPAPPPPVQEIRVTTPPPVTTVDVIHSGKLARAVFRGGVEVKQ